MHGGDLVLFALRCGRPFGEEVARHLGMELSELEERDFEDGEHKSRPLVNVRGKDVFVIESLYSDDRRTVDEKLCRLLFFLATLNDASAGRITAVTPYLAYARKDRKTQARDPVTTRYVAALLEAVGTDRVVVLDVHNLAAFQNAFRIRTDHLEARKLFIDFFADLGPGEDWTVVSPDIGGVKRADRYRSLFSETLGRTVTAAFVHKERSFGRVSGGALVGEVAGRRVLLVDDLISTGTTLLRAAQACVQQGAVNVYAVATHGLFMEPAEENLEGGDLERIVVTDSVLPFRLKRSVGGKLTVLSVAGLIAEAIRRIHSGGSLVELLKS